MEGDIDQRKSLERAIRLLGTLEGVILGGLGCTIGRISGYFLWLYNNVDHPVTWREPTLGALNSPPMFAASIILALAVIILSWRLSLPRAARLDLWLALLNVFLLMAAVYFFNSIGDFVAGDVRGALLRGMMSF